MSGKIRMANTVQTEIVGNIAHLRINRPHARNALSQELITELSAEFKSIDANDDIYVVVLSGVGDHFGAGYDLNVDWRNLYGKRNPVGTRRMLSECVEFEMNPWRCSKPVIAMVRGYCLAGSCELSMMCCVTYASDTARFGEPEIKFSAVPPALVMPWVVGLRHARELLYSGDIIDAQEALRIGLVNKVFPDDELEAETMQYARRVAAMDPVVVQLMKACINQTAEITGFSQSLQYAIENGAIAEATETENYVQFMEVAQREGLTAAIRWREAKFG